MNRRDDTLVLFPGALGDFICFLPTLLALRKARGPSLTLVAKPALLELLSLPQLTAVSIDRSEIADLFADSTPLRPQTQALLGGRSAAYSWTGARESSVGARLGSMTAGAVNVLPFRDMRPGEHAVDYYARSAGVTPVLPVRPALRIDRDWFADYATSNDLKGRPLLAIHPGSGSPAKNWTGFGDLAAAWLARVGDGGRVVFLRGPAEETHPVFEARPSVVALDGISLSQVAAVLDGCDVYAGNDSGISHLAGAVGATGVVLFAGSDPDVWAPRAAGLSVLRALATCGRCGPGIFCTHRLVVEKVCDHL